MYSFNNQVLQNCFTYKKFERPKALRYALKLFLTNQRKPLLKKKFRGSRLQIFFIIGDLKNFAILTRKHLCWRLFLESLKTCNFITKGLQHRCFPVNIETFLCTSFFIEHLWWLLLKGTRDFHVDVSLERYWYFNNKTWKEL